MRKASIHSLLFAAAVMCFCARANGQVAVNALSESQRVIELISPSHPGFNAALDADYAGLRQADGFEMLRPFIALLRNNSGHGIKAYVLKWNVVKPDGRTYKLVRIPWAHGGQREALTGELIVWKPGEPRLVSPSFDWDSSTAYNEKRRKLLSALAKGPLGTGGAEALNIEVSLDAVIYDDGVFSGPDTENFSYQYECERNGEQDEGEVALNLLEREASDEEIVERLNHDSARSDTEDATDRITFVDIAKGREARKLLTELKRNGRDGLKRRAVWLTSYARTALRRES
jgi:hypothetical protein